MNGVYRKVDLRDEIAEKCGCPEAVQLLRTDATSGIVLNENALSMFQNDELKNKKVCVISVAGATRQGKSFLLNMLLDFLYRNLVSIDEENWLPDRDTLFPGFKSKTQAERVTEGILIWPEAFLTKIYNEEIALILIDTQGTYDNETDMTQCTYLFALSILLSSVQIYNIMGTIRLNDLTDLQLFTGYAYMHQSDTTSSDKPFQKLLILVRDWSYPHDHAFGFEGGKNLLQSVYAKHVKSNKKVLLDVQKTINDNYKEVTSCLLPHPGLKITTNTQIKQNLADIDQNFIKCVQELNQKLLLPECLILKKICGEDVKFGDLSNLIKTYLKHFQSNSQLNVKTIFSATIEVVAAILIGNLSDEYQELLKCCKSLEEADSVKDKILEKFLRSKKLGDTDTVVKMQQQLIEKMDDVYNSLVLTSHEENVTLINCLKTKYESLVQKCNTLNDAEEVKIKILGEFNSKKKMGYTKLIRKIERELLSGLENIYKTVELTSYKENIDLIKSLKFEYKQLLQDCDCIEKVKEKYTLLVERFKSTKKMAFSAMMDSLDKELLTELDNSYIIFEVKLHDTNMNIIRTLIDKYSKQLENCNSLDENDVIKIKILSEFQSLKKLGNKEQTEAIEQQFLEEIHQVYKRVEASFQQHNMILKISLTDKYRHSLENRNSLIGVNVLKIKILKEFHINKKNGNSAQLENLEKQLFEELDKISTDRENILHRSNMELMSTLLSEYRYFVKNCDSREDAEEQKTIILHRYHLSKKYIRPALMTSLEQKFIQELTKISDNYNRNNLELVGDLLSTALNYQLISAVTNGYGGEIAAAVGATAGVVMSLRRFWQRNSDNNNTSIPPIHNAIEGAERDSEDDQIISDADDEKPHFN